MWQQPSEAVRRRAFLQAGTLALFGGARRAAVADDDLSASRSPGGKAKRCILLWQCGGPSQFETWDPKPGRITGGPFRSIPTKLPGVHFS